MIATKTATLMAAVSLLGVVAPSAFAQPDVTVNTATAVTVQTQVQTAINIAVLIDSIGDVTQTAELQAEQAAETAASAGT